MEHHLGRHATFLTFYQGLVYHSSCRGLNEHQRLLEQQGACPPLRRRHLRCLPHRLTRTKKPFVSSQDFDAKPRLIEMTRETEPDSENSVLQMVELRFDTSKEMEDLEKNWYLKDS